MDEEARTFDLDADRAAGVVDEMKVDGFFVDDVDVAEAHPGATIDARLR